MRDVEAFVSTKKLLCQKFTSTQYQLKLYLRITKEHRAKQVWRERETERERERGSRRQRDRGRETERGREREREKERAFPVMHPSSFYSISFKVLRKYWNIFCAA